MTKESSIVMISSIAIKTVLEDRPLSYHLTRAGMDQMAKYYAEQILILKDSWKIKVIYL